MDEINAPGWSGSALNLAPHEALRESSCACKEATKDKMKTEKVIRCMIGILFVFEWVKKRRLNHADFNFIRLQPLFMSKE